MHISRLMYLLRICSYCHLICLLGVAFIMTNQTLSFSIRPTNLECFTLNESVITFRHCYLKVVGRNTIAFNIHTSRPRYPKGAIIRVNFAFFKKASGYKPFLYNNTIDVCEFLKYKNHMLGNLIYDEVKLFTNLNHTCPIDHELIVKDCVMAANFMNKLPVPFGEYLLSVKISLDGKQTLGGKLFLTLS